MKEKLCTKCGKPLPHDCGRMQVCPACKKARQAELRRAANKRRGDEEEKKDRICERCGEVFHSRGPARVCASCRHRGLPREKAGAAQHTESVIRDTITLREYSCGPTDGSYRREDGVIILPPFVPHKRERKPPEEPPAGTSPGSRADVDYRLNLLNYQRHEQGLPDISYGQFVSQQYQMELLGEKKNK